MTVKIAQSSGPETLSPVQATYQWLSSANLRWTCKDKFRDILTNMN